MTLEEFRGWLGRLELTYPVLDWRVGGFRVWPMVRLMTHGANFHGRSEGYFVGAGHRAYARVLVQALVNWARATISDRERSEPPDTPADAVFLAYSIGRQSLIERRRYNPLLAPYVELLRRRGMRSRVWEMSPHGDYNVPRYTPSAFVQPWVMLSRIVSLVRPGIRFKESLPSYDALATEVEAAGLDFPYRDRDRLHRDVYFVSALSKRFKRWLKGVSPSVVFVADAGLREQALCLACRQMGITSVEIQHGVQDRNPTYAEWRAVPANGFALRPRVFWNWNEASAQAIRSWARAAPTAHTAVVGGDPWLDMWLSDGSTLAGKVRGELLARRTAVGGTKHILVTLSSIDEIVPGCVAGAVRNAPPDWRWWFRMHPVNQARRRAETRSVVRALGCDVDLMEFATEIPLFPLLQVMDAHLTVGFSTVVQQAAALGVPSVGCTMAVSDLFPAEAEQDMVRVAMTDSEIVLALSDFLKEPRWRLADRPADSQAAMDYVLALAPAPPEEGA